MLQSQVPKVSQQHHGQANRDDKMLKVLQNQNAITELLVKQQGQSQLPTKDMPVLKGDVTHCSTNLSSEHSSTQLNKIQKTIRTNCIFWNNLQLVNRQISEMKIGDIFNAAVKNHYILSL